MQLRHQDVRAIMRLWRDLSDFPASEPEEALAHCLSELARILGATNALWVGAVRDPKAPPSDRLLGWRPAARTQLHQSEKLERLAIEQLQYFRNNDPDPQTRAMVELAGTTRAYLRPEIVDDKTWKGSWLYTEMLRPVSVDDRLLGTHALDGKAESYIGVDRGPGDKQFGDRERDLLYLFLAGAPAFHQELMRSRGLVNAGASLSPRERDVLRLLLTDMNEPEIARALGLTSRTIHQYVVSISRKFRVKGRVGLMALWLRHRQGSPTT